MKRIHNYIFQDIYPFAGKFRIENMSKGSTPFIPPRKNWNLSIIREWIKRNYEVEYSQSGMADALHGLNVSYSRPTYTLKKADLEKQENFINDFEIIKKNSLMKK
ncbi:MAG: helix-turn-helix domain-containing protein [Desulfitobacteriaceae bacterium]